MIVSQGPCHELEPDEAVGRPPGFGFVAEQLKLQRQHAGPGLEVGIHAGCIGLVDLPGRGRQFPEIAFRDPVHAKCPHQKVGLEARLPHQFGESPGADPALQLHLPKPVLGVGVPHGESAVPV